MTKAILRVYLLEGVEAEGSLLVTHRERVIELTGATAKSGKSVVVLMFSPGDTHAMSTFLHKCVGLRSFSDV